MSCDEPVQWEKVLWKKQPFPDNHVPSSFLSTKRLNSNVRPYTYKPLVFASLSITQHASALFLFVATFIHLRREVIDPRFLVWACICGFLVGYGAWELSKPHRDANMTLPQQRAKSMKASILVFLALMAVTPVLKTLTEATSSDSIWALSAILFILNLLLADYGGPEPGPHRLTSVLSMNAAISASVVLASRLRSNLAVFALVLQAVLLFALFPILRKLLKRATLVTQLITTTTLTSAAVVAFYLISVAGAITVIGVLCFITLACPGFLVWAQRYKNEIRGPWDPAVPMVNAPLD